MSKEFRLEVGAQGLSTLIKVLATNTSNSDIPLKLNQAILGLYITDVSHSDAILLKKKIRSSRSTPPQHFPRDAPAKQDPEGEEIKDRGDKDSYKKFYEFPQNCELFSRAF